MNNERCTLIPQYLQLPRESISPARGGCGGAARGLAPGPARPMRSAAAQRAGHGGGAALGGPHRGGGGGSGARFLVTQHRGRARTGRAGLETYLAPSAEANSVGILTEGNLMPHAANTYLEWLKH